MTADKTTNPDALACSHCGKPIRDTQHAVNEVGRLHAENEQLRAALTDVLAEADRKTAAFERAHAVLGRDKCR